MAFDGDLLNRPSGSGGERSVSDALMLLYTGVYAPPPGASVLSPNGDGVADVEPLAYKIVRPSTVTASLVGPGRRPPAARFGPKNPGVYTYTWNGSAPTARRAGGEVEALGHRDGRSGRELHVEQPFLVNVTIGFLKAPTVSTVRAARPALSASFTLRRAAQVTATIRSTTGIVVATVRAAQPRPGPQTITWNGRTATVRSCARAATARVSA